MSTETPTILNDLLNRIEAIVDCKAGTLTELGEHIYPEGDKRVSSIRVSEWVRSRTKVPKGNTPLLMMEWASRKELEISKARGTTKYREAYKKVLKRRSTAKA